MPRILLAAGLAGLLCACTSMPDWGWLPGRSGPGLASGERQYDFRWRLSGDRAVAPLQVFDDGRQTWLQFAPGQAVPAIFRGGERGDQPLDYRLAGPYVVLDGVWPRLVLRGGGLRSLVERAARGESPASAPIRAALAQPTHSGPAAASPVRTLSTGPAASLPARPSAVTPPPPPPASPMPAPAAGRTAAWAAEPRRADLAAGLSVRPPAASRAAGGAGSTAALPVLRKPVAVPAGRGAMPIGQGAITLHDAAHASSPTPALAAAAGQRAKPAASPAPVAPAGPVAASYQVGPQDGTLRQALSRWARAAGWTFEPEHWAVDADIPITGSARFDSGFKRSVQDLVASTELSEKPLQPCFYSNKVLRIVPYAQACDRSADPARVS